MSGGGGSKGLQVPEQPPSLLGTPPQAPGAKTVGARGGGDQEQEQEAWGPASLDLRGSQSAGPRGWASNNLTRGHSVSVLASWGGAESDAEWRGGYKMNGVRAGWEMGWGVWV